MTRPLLLSACIATLMLATPALAQPSPKDAAAISTSNEAATRGPADAALVRRIHTLLNEQGYTIRGVQKLLGQKSTAPDPESAPRNAPIAPQPVLVVNQSNLPSPARAELSAIRESLVSALAADMD